MLLKNDKSNIDFKPSINIEILAQNFEDDEYYLVEREDGKTEWRSKSTLVSDGIGAVYGERGGLYGLNGIHGETSTRERLRTFDSYNHALERIKLWKSNKKKDN